jgi:quinol monooxygenase YgiN
MAKRAAKRKAVLRRRSNRASRNSSKPGKDAVTLIVQLRPRDGQETLLEAELRALIAPTRREDGCLIYDLFRSADAPAAFLLHEVWASREDHTRHTKTPHFLRWDARKDALLSSRDATFWKRVG